MQNTPNYGLKKPAQSDFYNVDDFNANADIIDTELKNLENNKLNKTGDASNVTNTFTQASTRANLVSGENQSTTFGKLMKWFADLKPVAWSGNASDLTEDASNRLVTDTEKTTWNAKASTAPVTTTANGLMISTDKSKLDGVATGANNYTHPSTHPPSIIVQDASNRFVTDAEKTTWNAKASTAVATQTTNGLMSAPDKLKLDNLLSGGEEIPWTIATPLAGWSAGISYAKTADGTIHLKIEVNSLDGALGTQFIANIPIEVSPRLFPFNFIVHDNYMYETLRGYVRPDGNIFIEKDFGTGTLRNNEDYSAYLTYRNDY